MRGAPGGGVNARLTTPSSRSHHRASRSSEGRRGQSGSGRRGELASSRVLCHHQSLGERRHPCAHESVEPVRLLPHRAVAAAVKYVQIRVRQA